MTELPREGTAGRWDLAMALTTLPQAGTYGRTGWTALVHKYPDGGGEEILVKRLIYGGRVFRAVIFTRGRDWVVFAETGPAAREEGQSATTNGAKVHASRALIRIAWRAVKVSKKSA